jgi:hypothetical protein
MLDTVVLDRVLSQPLYIETAMLQIKIFFMIVGLQITHLIHTLKNEVRYE